MSNIVKIKLTKTYLEKLAAGINPITGEKTDSNDIIHNKEIADTLLYASTILNNMINQEQNKQIIVSAEQVSLLKVRPDPCTVGEVTREINRIVSNTNMCDIHSEWINNWLISIGMLQIHDGYKVPTQLGADMGISTVTKTSEKMGEYVVCVYDSLVQQFIFDNLDNILAFVNNFENNDENLDDTSKVVVYTQNKNLETIIKENYEKCIMIATGTYDSKSQTGSSSTMLQYRNSKRTLNCSGFKSGSVTMSILHGILDAANAIKNPIDVLIISSERLGFNNLKSQNLDLCQKITSMLFAKNCTISVIVCEGKTKDINNYIVNNKSRTKNKP